MAELVFLIGHDTVAAQLAFAMCDWPSGPPLQRLKTDPAIVPAAVEDLLRRHAPSSIAS